MCIRDRSKTVHQYVDDMRLNDAIEEIMQFIRGVNKYMEENAPWKMVKEDKDGAGRILYTAGEALRLGAVLLSPIMPNRTKTLLDALNVIESNFSWGTLKAGTRIKSHEPLFPRIK